ncbi:isopentenyl-diphosphate Delta-isomerase [Amaricoccus solimangrovi]|uniref:Isopentenyl-diphosphate Delta-isomerase n=1 Tax=Amaricoccus solimangrovi TaxID=2589815 RepID=A0A501WM53_9RHOB|nr:isopentenyl-diphosphate Delta-isomerase [Amaricoccus solimangrovi]TPE49425.1 isopentenyl-diphosphate Delta-isomerase [Amaricoccus solimangrovi]
MTQLIPAWLNGELIPLDKLDVHRRGLRHPAVSVFLLRGDRLLIQRRALGKYHTPGLWANACCTHPRWGEAPADCAARRLGEELGLSGVALEPRGEIEYRAEVGGGMVEHEVVRLFTGAWRPELEIRPDPAEVMDWRWPTLAELVREIAEAPERFTPWLRLYLARHSETIFGAAA